MSDCILWTGAVSATGYGNVWHNGKQVGAHRRAWIEAHGPIADGLVVCHRCDVKLCINVEHLFLGTQAENVRDASAKGRLLTGDRWQESHPPSTRQYGVDHHRGNAHVTPADVRDIRRLVADGATQRATARQFGISPSQVSRIVRGLRWKELA